MSAERVPPTGYEHKINLADNTAVDQDLSPELLAIRAADEAAARQAQAAAAARDTALERLKHKARYNDTVRDLLIVLGL